MEVAYSVNCIEDKYRGSQNKLLSELLDLGISNFTDYTVFLILFKIVLNIWGRYVQNDTLFAILCKKCPN